MLIGQSQHILRYALRNSFAVVGNGTDSISMDVRELPADQVFYLVLLPLTWPYLKSLGFIAVVFITQWTIRMPNQKIERKCLRDVTSKAASTSNTAAAQNMPSSLHSMVQLEQKVADLNDRLDSLSAKFDTLISNVQRQRQEMCSLVPTFSSSDAVADCSSSAHTPSYSVGERSMKEQVKRAILGDESYSIYRKTLKTSRRWCAHLTSAYSDW